MITVYRTSYITSTVKKKKKKENAVVIKTKIVFNILKMTLHSTNIETIQTFW